MAKKKRRKPDARALPPGFAPDPDVPPLRVALLVAADSLVEEDLADAFRALGHQVMRLAYRYEGDEVVFEGAGCLADRVMKFGPHLIVNVNTMGLGAEGVLPGLSEAERAPLVCWFMDAPALGIERKLPPGMEFCFVATYDTAHVEGLRDRGYRWVEHLPLGTPFEEFAARGGAPAEPEYAVGYVGNLFAEAIQMNRGWLSACARMHFTEERAAFDEALEAGMEAFAPFGGAEETIWDWLRREAPRWFADPDRLFEPVAQYLPPAQYLAFLIAYGSSSEQRRRVAGAFEGMDLHVWGGDAWRDVLDTARCHEALPYDMLWEVYQDCAVNLSISHAQNLGSVTQRLFDVPACGAFLLSDWRPCMAELFDPDSELAVFHSPEEARELAERYSRDAKGREEIVSRARRRVLGEHTLAHRVERLTRMVLERWPEVAERPRRRKTVAVASPPEVAVPVLRRVGEELVRAGLDRASEPIRAALQSEPAGREELLRLDAVRAKRDGDHARAYALWREVLEAQDEKTAASQFAAGNACVKAEGSRVALTHFREAIWLSPYVATYWTSLAGCYLELEDWPRARAALETALELDPEYWVADRVREAFRVELHSVEACRDDVEGLAPVLARVGRPPPNEWRDAAAQPEF